MDLEFEHNTLGQRVLFAPGKAAEKLEAEVSRRGAHSIMLIASKAEIEIALGVSSAIEVALTYTDVAPHVPVEKAEKARAAAAEAGTDLLVCVGGGSTTGLAKAIALTSGLPIVAVPTTYAGSEATNVWGMTEASRKTTGVDDVVLPQTIIYDAELTYSLPAGLSMASGLNALAHCIDSMWAPGSDPINQALATEGIRALSQGLPRIKADPRDRKGREQALYGAYLSAVAFASAGSGMHHKICHVLGGAYNLPHAETHAAVLPHVLAFNAPAAPEAAARIAAAFGAEAAVDGLNALQEAIDAPRALRDYGLAETSILEAVQLILPVVPPTNPRSVTQDALRQLLESAWAGTVPIR
ncbi:maleylacetate reductase [Citricoccus nitrophenolicus]|uniref:maleylacetate reductase n=1 Tax=Citricoccus nitrophenolicus TaxID=863575 RepID=UPI0031E8AB11